MSKLKGLVIPEVTEGSAAVGERNSLTARHKSSSSSSKSTSSGPGSGGGSSLPSPPWKEKESGQQAEFPKYSPAFKRKPFTVYNTKKTQEKAGTEEKEENSPHYKPPIGKRNSDVYELFLLPFTLINSN